MNGAQPFADTNETRDRLEFEVDDVASAIALVASGAATAVTVAGLRFGDQVVANLTPRAVALAVRLEPLYWPDDAGCDILVRRQPDV